MKKILLALFAALTLSVPMLAQTSLTQTTLSASVNSTQNSVTVASAIGISAPGLPGGNQFALQSLILAWASIAPMDKLGLSEFGDLVDPGRDAAIH